MKELRARPTRRAVIASLGPGVASCAALPRKPAAARIVHIASYHPGYPPADEARVAFEQALPSVRLETLYLDAKRSTPAEIAAAAAAARDGLLRVPPDVLVASDDDAVGQVVVPAFARGPRPVVFWGVNWSADAYGLHREHVTGMVEVLPVQAALRWARTARPDLRRLVILSEDSASERRNREALQVPLAAEGLVVDPVSVTRFADWQEAFLRAQRQADAVFLPTNGAIAGWQDEEAMAFVARHTRVPTFSCDGFMVRYTVFGLVKVPAEQGRWAAAAVGKLLGGASPAALAWTHNQESRALVNRALAAVIGFRPPTTAFEWV